MKLKVTLKILMRYENKKSKDKLIVQTMDKLGEGLTKTFNRKTYTMSFWGKVYVPQHKMIKQYHDDLVSMGTNKTYDIFRSE